MAVWSLLLQDGSEGPPFIFCTACASLRFLTQADRFILGCPIDYGPVLLLMPFGSHLTVDTLPSEVQQAVASGRSWLYPAFAFVPVWTSPYLPLSPASEATNPASWIWRPSFERQRDFNPPEQRAAQRAFPICRPSVQNRSDLLGVVNDGPKGSF